MGLGYFLFLFFCPEEFHRALLGCAKKNSSQATFAFKNNHEKIVNAKSFICVFLVFQDPISPSPTCHPADAICHLSWSLLINKETVS